MWLWIGQEYVGTRGEIEPSWGSATCLSVGISFTALREELTVFVWGQVFICPIPVLCNRSKFETKLLNFEFTVCKVLYSSEAARITKISNFNA